MYNYFYLKQSAARMCLPLRSMHSGKKSSALSRGRCQNVCYVKWREKLLLNKYFRYFVTTANDVEAGFGVGNFYALEVVVYSLGVVFYGYVFNTCTC